MVVWIRSTKSFLTNIVSALKRFSTPGRDKLKKEERLIIIITSRTKNDGLVSWNGRKGEGSKGFHYVDYEVTRLGSGCQLAPAALLSSLLLTLSETTNRPASNASYLLTTWRATLLVTTNQPTTITNSYVNISLARRPHLRRGPT